MPELRLGNGKLHRDFQFVGIAASGANDAALLYLCGGFVDQEQFLAGHDGDFHHQQGARVAGVEDGIFVKKGTELRLVAVDADARPHGVAFAGAALDRSLLGGFRSLLTLGF